MRKLLKAVVLVALGATPALADCPTSTDLEKGVFLTREEPFYSVLMQTKPDGLSERRLTRRSGRFEAVETFYAHPLVVTKRTDAQGMLALDYSAGLSGLADLDRIGIWRSEVQLSTNGTAGPTGQAVISFKGEAIETVGGCSYPVWIIDDVLQLGQNAPYRFEKHFAPDLGLVLRAIRLGPDGTPVREVAFDRIEPAR